MTEPDRIEQVKKPSTGATITRKINTGEKYENTEIEVWASSGSLDDVDREGLKEELEDIVEDLAEIVEEKTVVWKAEDAGIDLRKLEDVADDVGRLIESGKTDEAAEKLKDVLTRFQSGR